MARMDEELSLDEAAALHDALGHPARVAALRVLRARKRLPLADLRREVAALHKDLDARSMQYHAHRMMAAGLVDVAREDGREVVELVLDAGLRLRPG